jgi:hypothetical protein
MSSGSTGTGSARVRVNDSTVLAGSEQNNITYTSESDIYTVTVVSSLSAGSYVTLQIKHSTSGTLSANAILSVVSITGIRGEKGDTGSGSNIIVQDEGISVPNTPHSTLNFTGAGVTVTDSGSVQKEAFILGVPCITLRDETEWEETVKCGMNVLVGDNTEKIVDTILNFKFKCKVSRISYCDCLGDGKAAMRIVNLCTQISRRKDE